MTNKKIINFIEKYQRCPYIHPLTCGNDSNHRNLTGFIDQTMIVKLKCLDCDYVQEYIPDIVFLTDWDKYNSLPSIEDTFRVVYIGDVVAADDESAARKVLKELQEDDKTIFTFQIQNLRTRKKTNVDLSNINDLIE
jgi:hypothetical protein